MLSFILKRPSLFRPLCATPFRSFPRSSTLYDGETTSKKSLKPSARERKNDLLSTTPEDQLDLDRDKNMLVQNDVDRDDSV